MASFISLQFGKQFCIPSFSNIDLKELYSVLFKILQITYLFSHYITSYYKFFNFSLFILLLLSSIPKLHIQNILSLNLKNLQYLPWYFHKNHFLKRRYKLENELWSSHVFHMQKLNHLNHKYYL